MKKKYIVNFKNNAFQLEKNSYSALHSKGYGVKEGDLYFLSEIETLYLLEKNQVIVKKHSKILSFSEALKLSKCDFKNYIVYKDLRSKGYRVKTGFKYGITFRVYPKGKTENEYHSFWLVEPVDSLRYLRFKDLSGKNRIAHSTGKTLVFAIVDKDLSITYIENSWLKV